jgi:hypothetical protein
VIEKLRLDRSVEKYGAFGAQFFSAAGSAALTLATAFALDAQDRGEFASAMLVPMLGSYLLSLGIPGYLLRQAAIASGEAPRAFGALILAHVGFAFIAGLLLLPWLGHLLSSLELALFAVIAFLAWTLLTDLMWIDYGAGRLALPTVIKGVIPLTAAALVLAAEVFGHATPVVAGAAFMAVSVAGAVLYASSDRLRGYLHIEKIQWAEALHYSGKYSLQQNSMLILQRGDQIGMAACGAQLSLGVYGVAASIAEVATYIPSILGLKRFRGASTDPTVSHSTRTAMVWAIGALLLLCLPVAFILQSLLPADYSGLSLYVLLAGIGVIAQSGLRMITSNSAGLGRFADAPVLAVFSLLTLAVAGAFVAVGQPMMAVAGAGIVNVIAYVALRAIR